MLKDSKKISAVCSRFSGGFSGGSVYVREHHQEEVVVRSAQRANDEESDGRCARRRSYGRATHQKEVVILGLRTKVLEDRLLPIPLHVIPILYLSVTNGIVDAIARSLGIGHSLIADEEVKVLDPAFGREMAGFGGDGRSARGLCSWAAGSYRCRKDTAFE